MLGNNEEIRPEVEAWTTDFLGLDLSSEELHESYILVQ